MINLTYFEVWVFVSIIEKLVLEVNYNVSLNATF
jgi:hypothetical protein